MVIFGCDFPENDTINAIMTKRIVIGTDHAGFKLKEVLKQYLTEQGIDVIDEGTFSEDPVDYPSIGQKVAGVMLSENILGIFLGGSGIGESIAGNKIPGIRAARCTTVEDAEMSRKHNDANMLCMGGRMVEEELAKKILDTFLVTEFEGERHEDRVKQIHEMDGYPYP